MKQLYSILMLATLAMLWGCSSSDDDDKNPADNNSEMHGTKVSEAPKWTWQPTLPKGDMQGHPVWNKVDFYDYENNMTAIVFVSQAFGTRISENDRMAAIIDGEVRDVREPVPFYNSIDDDDESLDCFMLYIPFRTGENEVELQYYCAQTNQTYCMKDEFSVTDDTVGSDEMFLFTFRPLTYVLLTLPDDLPFTPTLEDEMAVFIDDECYGVATLVGEGAADLANDIDWFVQVYNIARTDKKAHVRYYSAATQTIYETEPFLQFPTDRDSRSTVIETLKFK